MLASCWDWPSLKYVYFIITNKPLDAGGWGPTKGIAARSNAGSDSGDSISFDDCLPSLPKESEYVGTGDFCVGELYAKRDKDPRPQVDLNQLKADGNPQSAKALELIEGKSNSVICSRNQDLRSNPKDGESSSTAMRPAIWNSLIPVIASLGSGFAIYKGLQGMSEGNLETKHLIFSWAAGLAIGVTIGQEAARATYLSEDS
jgi:hypothetical protein